MQRREQLLAYALGVIAAIYFGGSWVYSTFITPINQRRDDLVSIKKKIDDKDDQLIILGAQRKKLKDWKARSLPPDPTKSNQRPDARNAQRLYQDWIHDLAQLSGFEDLKVSPDRRSVSKGNVFVSVSVKIEADARYDQLCHFLDRFYRTDLLHRVSSMRVQSKESEGNPFLQVTLEAEGLAIVDAPQNRRLFPQTFLSEDLSEDGTVLHVKTAEGFPTKPGFMVRLRSEYLTVTEMDGTSWTVERSRDETTATSHPAGTILELAPIQPGYTPRSADEFKQLIEGNIFVKPAPPIQYTPKFGPLGEKVFTRGRPIDFNIVLIGFDATKGRPEYALLSPQMTGMKIDKSTGKFSWSPASEQKSGTYAIKFEARHPSTPGGRLQGSVNLVVRDPNSPPKYNPKAVPKVYLGRDWKYSLDATDAETAASRLTWKLGDGAPSGMKINALTGELTWTPDDSVEPGDVSVQVIVSDDGMPSQSTTINLRMKVEDDLAMFTRLTGIFTKDEDIRAMLYDRSQDKNTVLRVGNQFAVADITGTVTKIDKKYLLFNDGRSTRRLELGQSLRETLPEVASVPDATQPANVPVRQ